MNFKELSGKKVLGVPVLYLGAAAVTILAIVAWKMKPAPTGDSETPADGSGDGAPGSGSDDPYGDLATGGTVVVQPVTPTPAEVVEETNETWERAAVDYLVNDRKMASAGAAQAAIRAYLDGGDLEYEQGLLRDAAVSKLGIPPEGLPQVGKTNDPPAQRQFSNFPGKHTVKGSNDNTPAKLANLYYGNAAADRIDKIVATNHRMGPSNTTYPKGTVVSIPKWINPAFVTATTSMRTAAQLASKNAISQDVLRALNPNRTFPVAVGTKIRIY